MPLFTLNQFRNRLTELVISKATDSPRKQALVDAILDVSIANIARGADRKSELKEAIRQLETL